MQPMMEEKLNDAERPEDKEENDTVNEQKREAKIVKCTFDQADPDPPTLSEIVTSGSNDYTYPKYPNRRLTDTTTLSLSQLQSMGAGGSNTYV